MSVKLEDVIQLKNVFFSYAPGVQVDQGVFGVDFSLKAGERVGLVGPNGSGKTTLFNLMVGLRKPQRGEINLFGKKRETEEDFIEARKKIGFLFQDSDNQLFCPTVLEDVAFGPLNLGYSQKEAREIALRTLNEVGLVGFEDRVIHKLSGGEKRLVCLATIMAMNPEILLLDEPTNGLDEESKERIFRILGGLKQAMVLVSHDPSFIEKIASRIVKIEKGRML